MPDLGARFNRSGYLLYPGPREASEPLYTFCVDEIEEYSYESIATAILAHPGCRQIRPPLPDWSKWQAEWQQSDRLILLDMLPDEDHLVSPDTGQTFWSGCQLVCDCLVGDLMDLWLAVHKDHPGVWLCDGGAYGEIGSRMFSPASFLAMPYIA
jgi:hypothetical protein